MVERSIPECPYCGEELQFSRVILNTDVGDLRANLSGTLYCLNKKCNSKKICGGRFELDSDGLVKEQGK